MEWSAGVVSIFRDAHLLQEQAFQFLSAVSQSPPVRGIHDPDECIGLFEVVLPVCAECFLTSDVPFAQVSRFCRALAHWGGSHMFSLYLGLNQSFAHSV